MILSLLGLSKQLEVLLVIIIGIIILALDTSLFHVKHDLEEIWNYEFDPIFHKNNVDLYLKYLLSGVVFVRTFTLHVFLAFYIVMLWPAIFADRPNLMVPWLVVGSVRSIFVNIVTLATGSYVCLIQKGYHLICLDFIMSQIIQHGPSVYAWLTVLSYYQDLCLYCEQQQRRKFQNCDVHSRRKRTRRITIPETTLGEKSSYRTFFKSYLSDSNLDNLLCELEGGDSPQIVISRSLDTLLKAKLDDDVSQDSNAEDTTKSISERAMALLNLTEEDVSNVKLQTSRKAPEKREGIEKRVISSVFFNETVDVKIDEKNSNQFKNQSCTTSKTAIRSNITGNRCQCARTK